jgi:hypothetical protein
MPDWNDEPTAAVYRATRAWMLGQIVVSIVFVAAAAALEEEIRNAPELGKTPEERLARFAQARKFARYAAFVGPALYLWSSFYPHPYALIIGLLAILPWLAVALIAKAPGVYQLAGDARSGRPDLTAALLGSPRGRYCSANTCRAAAPAAIISTSSHGDRAPPSPISP